MGSGVLSFGTIVFLIFGTSVPQPWAVGSGPELQAPVIEVPPSEDRQTDREEENVENSDTSLLIQ